MTTNFEISRKSIHALSLLTPFIYTYNRFFCQALIIFFILLYLIYEWLKKSRAPQFLRNIMDHLHRDEEKNKWAPAPLYLAFGVLGSFHFYHFNAAVIAIYCVGFCDIIAALCGKKWGQTKLPFAKRKTIVGTSAFFFAAIPICAYYLPPSKAITTALLGAFLESLPFKDIDNITIPLIVGFVANQFLFS